jgi:hypothetical protein
MLIIFLLMVMTFQAPAQQPPPKPQSFMAGDVPAWNRVLKLSDGRTFVTNGHIALDAAVAKPAALPSEVLGPSSSKVIERHLAAKLENECSLAELKADRARGRYVSPSGLWLNADYVDYLRRTLPPAARLRMQKDLDPIVIVLDGKAIGLLMAMRGPDGGANRPES